MLYTRNLAYAYPNGRTLRFPDMECAEGNVLLITGGSGVGKTTLLHLLAGLLKPSGGEVQVAGTAIQSLKSGAMDAFRGKHIGIIYQQSHFIAALSVKENLLLAKKDHTRLLELSQKLGIQSLLHKKPTQLSQGEQQRASITRALIQSPQLLLADEPTASLDDDNCIAVAKLLAAQAAEQKAALLIVTHDNRLKQLFANHITLS
ncbi:ABC transporter ATP-binding protein [Chitinophaga niabensis]|uniref:Putative ABC transport system ATP-binding protein n=1 Tax=Chitinophaga niabensis TaxID=536979 RepID=A0A1N6JV54_9BACT|nr:ATP-binding cassette domain-containing protein [Chitinophaga niabensis]SIO48133.1 putative ABC transport system ATP-binding protein [Chitinophaga niabensis]